MVPWVTSHEAGKPLLPWQGVLFDSFCHLCHPQPATLPRRLGDASHLPEKYCMTVLTLAAVFDCAISDLLSRFSTVAYRGGYKGSFPSRCGHHVPRSHRPSQGLSVQVSQAQGQIQVIKDLRCTTRTMHAYHSVAFQIRKFRT